MPKQLAVSLRNVTKVYRLYESRVDQAIDALGLGKILFVGKAHRAAEFPALRGITLAVGKSERVAVIGRNGAGKTTLLKLITGNFRPTSGDVVVEGTVQALMSVGLGFHPEFSGYENIRSALVYNGLNREELRKAIDDVIEFAELGEFLHQPLKTYSLGMQARLMFATTTAVKPDILVVDEVLGAGDAYFTAKSAHRMERLTRSGCTLLLVSHSMQQVLQFCPRAVWLERGAVVLDGDSLRVVKAYEEFTQKLERARENPERDDGALKGHRPGAPATVLENAWLREKILSEVLSGVGADLAVDDAGRLSSGGVSRWGGGERGLKIRTVGVVDDEGRPLSVARTGSPLNIELEVVAEEGGEYPCYAVVLLFSEDGRWLTRHCSAEYHLKLRDGEYRKIRLRYDQVLLGSGTYCFSAAIYKTLDLQDVRGARFYDLLSRSFQLRVVGPYRDDQSVFYHPAQWSDQGPEP